ncbi:MAG: histidinol-phosphatase HisJ [Romboutsia sp.]
MRDGHIHSPYCPHGTKDSFEEYITSAIKKGLKEMTFTEHLSLPNNFKDPSPKQDSAMSEEFILDYFNDVKNLKEKYKNEIKINIGVEVDFIEGYEEEIKESLNKYGKYLDDAILSVHMIKIEDKYYCIDFSVDEFGKITDLLGSLEDVYKKYYETVKLAINSDLGEFKPKRIGHLNLVRKFNQAFPFDYENNEILEEIVKLIKQKKYELDFNVSGNRYEYSKEPYIHGYLLDLINKYSIEYVYGSDSHSAKYVGKFEV